MLRRPGAGFVIWLALVASAIVVACGSNGDDGGSSADTVVNRFAPLTEAPEDTKRGGTDTGGFSSLPGPPEDSATHPLAY